MRLIIKHVAMVATTYTNLAINIRKLATTDLIVIR